MAGHGNMGGGIGVENNLSDLDLGQVGKRERGHLSRNIGVYDCHSCQVSPQDEGAVTMNCMENTDHGHPAVPFAMLYFSAPFTSVMGSEAGLAPRRPPPPT